jgi:ethanolamine utilization protein EutS
MAQHDAEEKGTFPRIVATQTAGGRTRNNFVERLQQGNSISGGVDVTEEKPRVIQEYVPGKQVTLVHLIAHPDVKLTEKLGLARDTAVGIMTITPSEAAIIAADRALKVAPVEIVFVDRFTGSLVITGPVSALEAALKEANSFLFQQLGFQRAELTRS